MSACAALTHHICHLLTIWCFHTGSCCCTDSLFLPHDFSLESLFFVIFSMFFFLLYISESFTSLLILFKLAVSYLFSLLDQTEWEWHCPQVLPEGGEVLGGAELGRETVRPGQGRPGRKCLRLGSQGRVRVSGANGFYILLCRIVVSGRGSGCIL